MVMYTGYDFGDVPSYPTPADDKTKEVVRSYLAWRKKNIGFMAADAINIMIDKGMISTGEVEELMKETPQIPMIPNNNIVGL